MQKRTSELLSELLTEEGLTFKINLENSAKSILEDLDYRYAVIALAVAILGKPEGNLKEIEISILSFGQFIATRPYLIPRLRAFASSNRNNQISFEEHLGFPRGYLRDVLFKESLNCIIAIGVLDFSKDDSSKIQVPNNSDILQLATRLVASTRLRDEQNALNELLSMKIPKYLIEMT